MTLLSFFCSEYIIVFSRQNLKVSEFVENWESTITNTIDFSTVFEILLNKETEGSKWRPLHPPVNPYDSRSFMVLDAHSMSFGDLAWKKNTWKSFPYGRNLGSIDIAILTKIFTKHRFGNNNKASIPIYWMIDFFSHHCVLVVWRNLNTVESWNDPQFKNKNV